MFSKKTLLILFCLLALVQLYVPANMIWQKEQTLKHGRTVKFKTAPVDPNHPFIGKYIYLNFDATSFELPADEVKTSGQQVYVLLENDAQGYVKIKTIKEDKPAAGELYVLANVQSTSTKEGAKRRIVVSYPFNRYYMDEFKAYEAEQTYELTSRDSTQVAYALVSIRDGDAVVKDVMINEVSIKDIVAANQAKKQK